MPLGSYCGSSLCRDRVTSCLLWPGVQEQGSPADLLPLTPTDPSLCDTCLLLRG